MRISDWSSDVCSSDLKLGDGMIHVSYRRPDDGKRWEARCEMVGDNQLRWAAFNAFGDGQMGRWRSEDRIDISIADGKMKVDVSRSEEHTSELQSLMRISYAVFCLKRKIYSIINKSTIHSIQ